MSETMTKPSRAKRPAAAPTTPTAAPVETAPLSTEPLCAVCHEAEALTDAPLCYDCQRRAFDSAEPAPEDVSMPGISDCHPVAVEPRATFDVDHWVKVTSGPYRGGVGRITGFGSRGISDGVCVVRIGDGDRHICVEQLEAYLPEPAEPVTDLGHLFRRPTGMPEHTEIPVDQIVTGRFQPRRVFDEVKLVEMAESMKLRGVLTPLRAFTNERGEVELIGGERRYRAAKLAGLATVPAQVVERTLGDVHEESLLDNLHREDLTPLEEGRAYLATKTLYTISDEEVARRYGRSRTYVQQRIAMVQSCPEIQAAVEEGRLTFSQARGIVSSAPGDERSQVKALAKVGLDTRQTEKEIAHQTDNIVRDQTKKKISDLGWKIHQPFGMPLVVFSEHDRPREWGGAEMLRTVRDQRRPTEKPDELPLDLAPTLTDEDRAALEVRGWRLNTSTFAPWVQVERGYSSDGLTRYLAVGELPAFAAEVVVEVAAVDARLAAMGWKRQRSSIISAEGREESAYGWTMLSEKLGLIEAGKISPTPEKTSKVAADKWTCDGCKKVSHGYAGRHYIEGSKSLCKACDEARDKRRAEERRVAGELISARLLPALNALPEFDYALPLLLRSMVSTHAITNETLLTATPEWLVGEMLRYILRDISTEDAFAILPAPPPPADPFKLTVEFLATIKVQVAQDGAKTKLPLWKLVALEGCLYGVEHHRRLTDEGVIKVAEVLRTAAARHLTLGETATEAIETTLAAEKYSLNEIRANGWVPALGDGTLVARHPEHGEVSGETWFDVLIAAKDAAEEAQIDALLSTETREPS